MGYVVTESIKTGVVPRFDGEHFFLSNFYEAPFTWRNAEYKSGEHAFQAAKGLAMLDAKIDEMRTYQDKVIAAPTPGKAKYLGRSVRLDVEQWERVKVQYMREIVHAKFYQVPGLAGQLVNTGAMLLVEGNDWNDSFWGRCLKDGKMVGLNTLGTILMETRGYWLHGTIRPM